MEADRQKEAERLYCRLMSSDPDFNDCTDAANFIRAVAADLKGPDGFESWKDAAVDERVRRVKAEAELDELRRAKPEPSEAVRDAVRDALELYADSYDRMSRQNQDCKVSPTDVAYDIRRNMVESTISAIAAARQAKEKGK